MSSKVTGWVWDQDLPAQPKLLLLWLAEPRHRQRRVFSEPSASSADDGPERKHGALPPALAWRATMTTTASRSAPLLRIIERRVAGDRNTSNVYVLLRAVGEPRASYAPSSRS